MSEATCHLCRARSAETSAFLVQLSARSTYPGARVHSWLHYRARACAACRPQIRALTLRRRIALAMLLGATASMVAFFQAALHASGSTALVLWGAIFCALVSLPFLLITRAERAVLASLSGIDELRELLATMPAGGLRHRSIRVFGSVRDDVQRDLDDFLRERRTALVAPVASARERLYRS